MLAATPPHSPPSILVLLQIFSLHFQVESSDLIAYGLIPEFIGRFPILVSLSALTEDQLVKVNWLLYCVYRLVIFGCVCLSICLRKMFLKIVPFYILHDCHCLIYSLASHWHSISLLLYDCIFEFEFLRGFR